MPIHATCPNQAEERWPSVLFLSSNFAHAKSAVKHGRSAHYTSEAISQSYVCSVEATAAHHLCVQSEHVF